MDERFTLVAANGSGAGGAGSFRIEGPGVETLDLITRPSRFAYWFHPRLRWFKDQEERLPFDQHFLKALVAPRALIATDALGDLWANPLGTAATSIAAAPVFRWLGAVERNALHFRPGNHDLLSTDWRALLDFAVWHWSGDTPEQPQRFWQPAAVVERVAGDVDGDGRLSIEDFFTLADFWQKSADPNDTGLGFTARRPHDLDGDGRIGPGDLDIFADRFSTQEQEAFSDCVPAFTGSLTLQGSAAEPGVRLQISGNAPALNGYVLRLEYDAAAYRLVEVEHAATLSWMQHTPGSVALAGAAKGGGAVADGPLAELAFEALKPEAAGIFRLTQAYVRTATGDTEQTSPANAVLSHVLSLGEAVIVSGGTAVVDGQSIRPAVFALGQNRPNPFNASTLIPYSVGQTQRVRLAVYDLLGRKIRTLVDRTSQPGPYTLTWDGRDEAGQRVAAGLYLIRMTTGPFQETAKALLVK